MDSESQPRTDRASERDIVRAILSESEVRRFGKGYVVSQYRLMRRDGIEPIPAAILTTRVLEIRDRGHVMLYYNTLIERVKNPTIAAILTKTASHVWPADKWPGQQVFEAFENLEEQLGDSH